MVFKYLKYAVVLPLLANCGNNMEETKKETVNIPVAEKHPRQLVKHGVTRTDDYFWLNERENPKVTAYLKAENAYTEQWQSLHDSLYKKVLAEVKSRVLKDDESVPVLYNDYWYYSRYSGDDEYATYYRSRKNTTDAATAEKMLDVNQLAEGKPFCEEGTLAMSPGNRLLAYSVDFVGRRRYEIRFRDLKTGKDLEEVIKNTTGSMVWAADSKTLFYTIEDDVTLRAYRVMRHVLGTPVNADVCVYEEKDETFFVDVDRSKSGNYIFIGSFSTQTSEYRYLDANKPLDDFTIFSARQRDVEYYVDEADNTFFIRTNYQAPNYRVCSAQPGKTDLSHWKDVFKYNEDIFVQDFELLKNYMVLEERVKGLVQIRVTDRKTGVMTVVDAPEEDYAMGLGSNEEYDTDVLRYYYGSLKTPACEYDLNLRTGEKTLLKQQKLNVPYDPSKYETRRIYARATDGREIPISVVYRADLFKPGTNPCLVYGYGSYGVINDPYFSGSRLSLLDRGFVFALAHIRGGEELGRYWYEEGRLLNKKNTFTDFIACSHYLADEKYAAPDKIFAQGGSAGGLLMGAVVNMEPALYRGVIAEVPFVDVVTTMLDTTIPLTTGEFDEWGNPENKEYFDYMLSYSPYDNVQKTAYPAMLVTTGLHDSQVQFWEPAKWVAKLRQYKTDDHILLLQTNMDAGHGGASGRFEGLKEIALNYTFLLTNL